MRVCVGVRMHVSVSIEEAKFEATLESLGETS